MGYVCTELRKFPCTRLRECCRQVEAEVITNSRNKLHQTTYKHFFSALYYPNLKMLKLKCQPYLCEYAVVHHGSVQARLHEGQGAYEAEVDEQALY